MMVCAQCMQKEINAQKEIEATADNRLARLEQARTEQRQADILASQVKIDYSAEVSTDKFNQDTISIIELKKAIDADDSIENKALELFTRLKARFDHDQEIIFQAQKTIAEASTEQRSIQQYFNEFSNQLRQEEREKLRIQDLNYKPKPPAKPKKAKTPAKKKYDRAEVARIAEETGVAPSTIQGLCISFNIEPKDVPAKLNEMKSNA